MPSDLDILGRISAGDSGSFRLLLERYGPMLYGYLVCRMGSRTAAEDAYAEVWMKVWRALPTYKEMGSLKSWLFTVAHRHSLDRLEQEARRRVFSLDASSGPDSAGVAEIAASIPGPEREYHSAHIRERLRRALDLLPPIQREVFLLREYGGLSFVEISQAMNCPLGTALARMRYAVMKLRLELEDLDA